jgi:hypothetical protein
MDDTSATSTLPEESPVSLWRTLLRTNTKAVAAKEKASVSVQLAQMSSEPLPPGVVDLPQTIKSTEIPPTNKTLVVVLGDLRCGENAWQSLYRNVLDENMADLAVFSQVPVQETYRHANVSIWERARHVEIVPRYHDWADAIDHLAGEKLWRDEVLQRYTPHTHPLMLGGIRGFQSSAAIVFWFRWYLAQRIRTLQWATQYDRFIITRTDQYYSCPLRMNTLKPERIWVPTGQNYRGITDRFYIAPADVILETLEVFPLFLRQPDIFANFTSRLMNPETFLRTMWTKAGLLSRVYRFRRIMFTCMTPIDTTKWGVMREKVQEGVHLKYPDEYTDLADTCERVNHPERYPLPYRKGLEREDLQ